jgi:DNA-3-methyladenine glycosylase II
VLSELVTRLAGLRPPLSPDPFETLVSAISAQQVSLQSAFATRSRFVERFGILARYAHSFPTRERVAQSDEDELAGLGFSRRKAEYILGVARADLDFDELARRDDDDVKAALTALRGLGEWSADWYLARHLARPHAWPAGDLGLRKAVSAFYRGGEDVSIEEVRAMAPQFAPFENLSAHYLLASIYGAPAGT